MTEQNILYTEYMRLTILVLQQTVLLTIVAIDLGLRIFQYYVTRTLKAARLEIRLDLVGNSDLLTSRTCVLSLVQW